MSHDPVHLVRISHMSHELESWCHSIYLADPAKFDEIRAAFAEAYSRLRVMTPRGEYSCPSGSVNCPRGCCPHPQFSPDEIGLS